MKHIAQIQTEFLSAFNKTATKIDTSYGEKILNLNYQIPYLAGYSKDGKTIYIDRRIRPVLKLNDNRTMNIIKYIIIHESAEKHLEDTKKYKYPYAHEKATKYERHAIEADGYPWDEYQKYCLSEVKRLKKLGITEPVPLDYDDKPERDSHDYYLLNKIHKSASNLYKPLIFSKTIYRQPTDEELVELNSWNLSADEIYQGFCYTMVGRGRMRQHEKYLINDAIQRLYYMYPHNNNYRQALAKAKNIGCHL